MFPSRKLLIYSMLLVFTQTGTVAVADDGTKIFTEACSGCHSAKSRPLDNIHLTKEQWKETVDRMIDLGSEVPKSKMSELLDYLVATYGPASSTDSVGKVKK